MNATSVRWVIDMRDKDIPAYIVMLNEDYRGGFPDGVHGINARSKGEGGGSRVPEQSCGVQSVPPASDRQSSDCDSGGCNGACDCKQSEPVDINGSELDRGDEWSRVGYLYRKSLSSQTPTLEDRLSETDGTSVEALYLSDYPSITGVVDAETPVMQEGEPYDIDMVGQEHFEDGYGALTPNGSDGKYYDLPPGAKELADLIEDKDMNFNVGNIFKATYRLGSKPGVDEMYDLEKIIYFAERELKRLT